MREALLASRGRRVKQMTISPDLILDLLKVEKVAMRIPAMVEFESDPIPESARALRCGIDPEGSIVLIIEDESFPFVREGQAIPPIQPQYRITAVDTNETNA